MNSIYLTLRHQSFSLPNSIIYYITKNPKTPKCYQKMIKCCKYFFFKNPILVLHSLFFKFGQWKTCSSGKFCDVINAKILNLENTSFKVWIRNTVRICASNQSDSNLICSIIPRIYKCDAACFSISNVTLYFDQFLSFASASDYLTFDNTIIKLRNEKPISIPVIVENLPKITTITFYNTHTLNINSNTIKELIKLPKFSEIMSFEIYNILESFDIDTLYNYIKKKRNTQFYLKFAASVSETYKNRLEEIVDELLGADSNLLISYITFPGMDETKRKRLLNRYMTSF